jgi:uncharacterized repeat protein (TIGR02543 family)
MMKKVLSLILALIMVVGLVPTFAFSAMAIITSVDTITDVPTTATAGTALTLTGTGNPPDATNTRIEWSVVNHGATGATINGNTLDTTAAGAVVIMATIENGTEDGIDYTQEFSITISAPSTVTISAIPSPVNGGFVTGGGIFSQSETVTLQATAYSNWTFDGWYEDGVRLSTNATWSATATSDRTLEARFSPKPPEQVTIRVTASPTNGGSVSGGGAQSLDSSFVVNAIPNSGWIFSGWYVNNQLVSSDAHSVLIAWGSYTLEARFTRAPPNTVFISVFPVPSNGGFVSGGGEHTHGTTAALRATASPGFTFDGWYEAGSRVSTNASWNMPVESFRMVEARFIPVPSTPAAVRAEVSRLEQKYGINIDVSSMVVRTTQWEIDNPMIALATLDEALSIIPTDLHNAIVERHAATGRRINIIINNPSPQSTSFYLNYSLTLEMNQNALKRLHTIVHEYGHLLHFAIGPMFYSWDKLRPEDLLQLQHYSPEELLQLYLCSQLEALNNGVVYDGFLDNSERPHRDPSVFVAPYAMANNREDFAVTFTWATLFGSDYFNEYYSDLYFQEMRGNALKKVQLIDQVARARFLIDRAFTPSVDIPQLPLSNTLQTLSNMLHNPVILIIYGDLNGDGVVDSADLILMLRYFAQPGTVIDLAAADVNGDGVVNNADLILLLRYFAQPGVILGPQNRERKAA